MNDDKPTVYYYEARILSPLLCISNFGSFPCGQTWRDSLIVVFLFFYFENLTPARHKFFLEWQKTSPRIGGPLGSPLSLLFLLVRGLC